MKNNRIANKFMPIYRKAQVYDKKASKNKMAGYSNNPDYFGDWYGDGQIDFTKIINPNDSGDVYMVKMWCGSGAILDVYLVKADDIFEAIDRVFEWSYENEGKNNLIFDYDFIRKEAESYYNEMDFLEDGKKPSDDMEFEEFLDFYKESSDFVANSDYTLFALSNHFFVDKVPEKYLK